VKNGVRIWVWPRGLNVSEGTSEERCQDLGVATKVGIRGPLRENREPQRTA